MALVAALASLKDPDHVTQGRKLNRSQKGRLCGTRYAWLPLHPITCEFYDDRSSTRGKISHRRLARSQGRSQPRLSYAADFSARYYRHQLADESLLENFPRGPGLASASRLPIPNPPPCREESIPESVRTMRETWDHMEKAEEGARVQVFST